jgi:hypothetical protein
MLHFNPCLVRAACTAHSHFPGAVAQLGERRVRNAEVRGSIPLGSTIPSGMLPYKKI